MSESVKPKPVNASGTSLEIGSPAVAVARLSNIGSPKQTRGYIKIAAAAGISYSECRKMTPAAILTYAEAYADRQRQTAYLQGLVTRAMIISGLNGKPAPSYEAMFGLPAHIDEPMDDTAMFNMAQMLNLAMGGDDYFTDKEAR